ncbi:hypothetical protein LEFCBN_LEFCBN_12550, partial [Dysosmobacter welbionis]
PSSRGRLRSRCWPSTPRRALRTTRGTIASGLPRRTCRSSAGCWRRTLNHWTVYRSRWRPPVSSSYWSGCVRKQGW